MIRLDGFRLLRIGLLPAWLVLFSVVPLLLVLVVSGLTRDESGLIAPVPTLANYQRLLDPIHLRLVGRSLLLALEATLLCWVIAYPFAYLLTRAPRRLQPLLLILVIIPFWTNSLVRTYAIRGLLAAKGVINQALIAAGLIETPVRLLYTEAAVAIGLVYVLLPFMILPLHSSFEKLDWRLVEAAHDLGANRRQTLLRVIVPLTAPGIVAGCLLVFLPALGLFFVTDVLGGARELLIGNFLKDQFLDARDWPFGAAASLVLILLLGLLLVLYGLVQRRWRPGDGFDG